MRQKVILTPSDLHALLGLPSSVRVVAAMRDPERMPYPDAPFALHVAFEGEHLPSSWRLPDRVLGGRSRTVVPTPPLTCHERGG